MDVPDHGGAVTVCTRKIGEVLKELGGLVG